MEERLIVDKALQLGETWSGSIQVEEDGHYAIELIASANTNWQQLNNEGVMIRLYLNEAYQQDFIIFYGQTPFNYKQLLGSLPSGTHQLKLEACHPQAVQLPIVNVDSIIIKQLDYQSDEELALQYAPKLYGRAVYSDYDNLYTDIPLEMIYFIEEWAYGKVIEYHIVFSHEDEGTPAKLLMAKWGRLLDIEYMARVYLTEENKIDHIEYQGAEHEIKRYHGELIEDRRPILQTATCNGNFTDQITSDYSFSLLPSYHWQLSMEPREIVMEKFPYINDVMFWEANRQLAREQLTDLQNYLLVQASVWNIELGIPAIDFTCQLKNDITIYSSSLNKWRNNHFWAAYTGPYRHFTVAIPLPEQKRFSDMEKLSVRMINDAVPSVTVKGIKVLSYDQETGINVHLNETFQVQLTHEQSEQVIWRKTTGVSHYADNL
ncbi:hypothetical protein SAMN04488134_10275 [Amphibacillus marinus]|uniref:Uncharacterized protein n=1 Tax=Amphibacillus marinus TaxID=872970 RepID=A0A1H8JU46_9BACI|nr:hypothetical protein [Amphibacillus marinus]SEN84243.1 hypothetical protein SAMN04488134_10275 [Amphibacillus marinus]